MLYNTLGVLLKILYFNMIRCRRKKVNSDAVKVVEEVFNALCTLSTLTRMKNCKDSATMWKTASKTLQSMHQPIGWKASMPIKCRISWRSTLNRPVYLWLGLHTPSFMQRWVRAWTMSVITWFFNSHTVLISCSDFVTHLFSQSPHSVMLRHSLSNHLHLSILQTYSSYLHMSSLCHHFWLCGKTIVLLSSLHFSG